MQFWRRQRQQAQDGLNNPSAPRASYELREDHDADRRHTVKPPSSSVGTSLNYGSPSLLSATSRHCASHFGGRSLPTTLDELEAFETWRAKHPCILEQLDEITALLKGKRLAVFLDYDGTLTPIVSNPDEAILSEQMRDVVRNLATQFPTAIISGRGREKVENFVKLKELYYAGSHGMDIAGPTDIQDGKDSSFQPAAHFRPLIDEVYKELCERLEPIPGSSVEHNTFCVSAHFRNCQGETWEQVVQVVEEVVGKRANELCITRGRKVVEVRPKVNWNKGTALIHLLKVLGLQAKPDVVTIYIGDDHTDEDAFKALRDTNQGFGVLVTTKVKDTAARYTVREPYEVMEFLAALVAWAQSPDNGWHTWGARMGWVPSSGSLSAMAAAAAAAEAPASAADAEGDADAAPGRVDSAGGASCSSAPAEVGNAGAVALALGSLRSASPDSGKQGVSQGGADTASLPSTSRPSRGSPHGVGGLSAAISGRSSPRGPPSAGEERGLGSGGGEGQVWKERSTPASPFAQHASSPPKGGGSEARPDGDSVAAADVTAHAAAGSTPVVVLVETSPTSRVHGFAAGAAARAAAAVFGDSDSSAAGAALGEEHGGARRSFSS